MALLASLFFFGAALSPQMAMDIGVRVWQNECAGTVEGLVCWNPGEEFASLGIGHFIWYPSKAGPYVETFPSLLAFLKSKNIRIPAWLTKAKHCPWKNRDEFNRAKSSKKMAELRTFLKNTLSLQAEFLSDRLEQAIPLLEKEVPKEGWEVILARYRRIAAKPTGLYALLDYVNFKGYGTSPKERYAGAGWGLLQVLEGMSAEGDPIEEFIRSAKAVLIKRVENAPAERGEQRYLAGWFNRIETYRPSNTNPKK